MKKVRLFVAFTIVLLATLSWYLYINKTEKISKTYCQFVSLAEENRDKQLYQKAILSYKEALKLKDSEGVRRTLVDVCKIAAKEGVIEKKEYIAAMVDYCRRYPNSAGVWEMLISESINDAKFKEALSYYKQAKGAGVSSEELETLHNKIIYSHTVMGRAYYDVIPGTNGLYSVRTSKRWGIIDENGESFLDFQYDASIPAGPSGLFLLSYDGETKLIDKNKVVQAIVTISIIDSRVANDGLLPVFDGMQWRYYDYASNTFVLDGYDDVSCFTDGRAVVKQADKWFVIDKTGARISNAVFDNVVILDNGEYLSEGAMIASVNGEYGFFKTDGTRVNDFACAEMGFNFGELVAFKSSDGKWGYVDNNGSIIIEPLYETAKSFCNGLGAVMIDGKWGFINSSGKLVIDNQFFDAFYFTSGGVCPVGTAPEELHLIKLRF